MPLPTLPPYRVRWHAAGEAPPSAEAGRPAAYDTHFPVPLPDGSRLELPLRALPSGDAAIALLMSNQTPFEVEDRLVLLLADRARSFAADIVVAVPTMGLDYGRRVARELGHPHYAALGLSRKFWYDESLCEPLSSSTSPHQAKRVYLDPALLDRVAGRRVLLVDDVINTGTSACAAIRLLERAGAQVAGLLVVLTEGHAWRAALGTLSADGPTLVHALGHIPMFRRGEAGGWVPDPSTL